MEPCTREHEGSPRVTETVQVELSGEWEHSMFQETRRAPQVM
jgi:hypothetical protein